METTTHIEDSFHQNLELDANLVLAGMRGGIDGIMNFAFSRKSIFTTANMATERCLWLKTQGEDYINKVSLRAAELEQKL